MFYKGYIITNENKQAITKFKNVPSEGLYKFDEVKSLPNYAGVLSSDTVLVDVDDMKQSNLLLDICDKENIRCKVLQSRSGMHFLFKNSKIEKCYTKTKVACGLTVDFKSGFKNSYEALCIDGKERTVLYDILEGEEYQEIPKWLYPIKTNMEFLDMDAGDGRNNALFTYILTLQSNDFTVEESRETIRIINEYVLKEPLTKEELDVVLRDEAFQLPSFFKGNAFLHDKFATFLKNNNHIIRINGQLHIYKNGVYVSGQDEIESAMIQHISALSRAKRTEVLAYLNILIRDNTPVASPNYIAFRNGIYNLETDELLPFNPGIIITNKIPWDFNANAYSETVDKVLNNISCNDKEIRQTLEECIGSCFYRSNTLGGGKCFILTGEGSNGKSTFLEMIDNLLGEENISSVSLNKLTAKFENAELYGKLANVGDDISDEFVTDSSFFKKLATGNRVQVQRKGERPFEFNNYAKLLFSANNVPRIKDRTGAVLRRLLIVPFTAKFTSNDSDYDEFIGDKLQSQEAMEYLINLGISALKNVIKNHKFSESEKTRIELAEYEETNNPVVAFINECKDDDVNIKNEPVSEVYENYTCFCKTNGYQALSRKIFTKHIKQLLNLESKPGRISGKVIKIFKVVEDDE